MAAPRILLALACLWLAIGAETSHAQLYWDTNGSTVGSGNAGGIWGTNNFWSTSSLGTSATIAYPTGSPSSIVFGAGIDGIGSYTVTVATGFTPTVSGINFQEGHVTLAPTTPLTESITLTGTAPTVNVQNMDSIITTRLTGTGLTKTGVGKLTLNYGAFNSSNYFNLAGAPITINGGTLEFTGTGTSANQLNASNGIVINSGGTFLWNSGVNNISDGALITVNTGGTLVARVNDQIGGVAGSGLLSMQGGAVNVQIGANAHVYSGLITGGGTLQFNNGSGSVSLTNANPYTGAITAQTTSTATGMIRLANRRAAQNATIRLGNTTTTVVNIGFASGIGTFVVGALEGTSNLSLQDVSAAAITLQAGNNDVSTVYRGVLTGSGGLTKIGTGTLSLTGETAGGSTYIGDTTVNGGAHNATNASINSNTASTLKVDFGFNASPTANIVNPASRLVLGGGRLWVSGKNTAVAVSQTFNGTQLNAGRSYVTASQGSGAADTVVNLGAITRSPGGIVEFTQPVTGTISLTHGITTTRENDASGILGAWATVGLDWATKNTAGTAIGNVVAAGAGVYTAYGTGDIAATNATNLLVNNAETTLTTATGTTDVNTIMVRNNIADGSTVNRTIDVAAGETLRVSAAGGIWTQGTGTLRIGTAANVGILTAGGAPDTPGELILNHAGGDFTINSSIRNNGTGVVTLVRSGGNGNLVLAGANTYTGGTILAQGRTRVDNAAALGSGPVNILPGAQLWINTNGTYTNDITIAGSGHGESGIPGAIRFSTGTLAGTITLAGDTRMGSVNGATGTITGRITGDYGLDLAGGASGVNTVVISNPGNDFTGNFSLNTNLNGTTAFGGANSVVRLGAEGVIPNGVGKGNVILSGSTGTTTLDLNGFNETVNSLISYGTHANTFITNGKAGTTATFTIGDNNTSTLVAANAIYSTFFGGVMQDTGTGILALTKIGEGTQTLTGANTYSGLTTINKGIVQAGALNTLSANSDVVIASDATAMLALTNGFTDFSQTIRSLSGAGTVNLGTIAAADTVALPATRLTTGSTADTLYSGTIVGGGGLVKQGTGRFTLTGNNTYVGTTTVSTGNLQVGVAGTGTTGIGTVTVASNATLSGTGSVQGSTIVNGTLKPGDDGGTGIGRLTFTDASSDSLSLASGGSSATPRIEFTLAGATGNEANPTDGIQTAALLNNAPAAGTHDSIEVGGTLNLTSGSTIKVVLASTYSPMWGDVFNLLDWGTLLGGTGAINAGGFNAAATGGDLDLEVSSLMTANGWSWNTDQFLTSGVVFVVPEPGRATLLLVGFLVMFTRRRRR